ncbi:hypothetical protein [Altererythrobacter sp. Root672]|uniref:hypothetical protein n=1 Tax=Altererythrobacter sp. Root672 TaxID=1736584 RepID=UPI0006FD6B24|nr:hypothetical protein [Altererythrobacter sp. Root672]KRA83476.1 hypothetical protein ASD76_05370 [Altererythrobacter sp. Root672]
MSKPLFLAVIAALALAGCSQKSDSDDDFASRVGADGKATPAGPVATTAVVGPPTAGTDVRTLDQLGNISGVDLGARAGTCTFASNEGAESLTAGAPADPASAGTAVVRVNGKLYQLASSGGFPAIRKGTRFSGEGITVDVAGNDQSAILTVTDSAGQVRTIGGKWICA